MPPPPPSRARAGLGRPATRASAEPTKTPTARGVPAPTLSSAGSSEAANAQVEAWGAELQVCRKPARAARIRYELGRLHEGPLADPKAARTHYQAALEGSPEHLPSLRGARRTALALGDRRGALPLFDAEARITADPARKAALFYAKGRVLEDALGQPEDARRAYATAAELARDTSVLKALEQRDRALEDWSALGRTLERAAGAIGSDPRHRAMLIIERARLLEYREEQPDAAIELYQSALELHPESDVALDALERLCQSQRRWRDLVAVLERKTERASRPGDRANTLYRVSRLHAERLANREPAIAALERARKESPDDRLVLEELARLLEDAERWDGLVEVLASLAALSDDPRERLALAHRRGDLLESRLDRPEAALEAYREALDIDPAHVPTLQAAVRLHTAAGSWRPLIVTLEGEARAAAEPGRRAAAHARIAEILERREGERDEAIAHHARALSLQPGFEPSFKALTRLYAETGQPRALIEIHERAVKESGRQNATIAHLLEIGTVYERSLSEFAQAAHTYGRVLALEPKHLGALHALQRAAERAGRFAELVDALTREAKLVEERAEAVGLLYRAAEVLDEELGDGEAAAKRYREILQLAPAHAPTLAALGRLYERAGRWDDLLEHHERELALEPSDPATLLHRMGTLLEERIGDEGRAIECFRRALDADARHRPSLRALSARLRTRGDHEGHVLVLELELEGLSESDARTRAAYRLGQVYEEQLSSPDRASMAYETALAASPHHRPSLEALARLRSQQGSWRRLVDQLDAEAAVAEDEDARVAKWIRAGEIWAHALGDPRRAVGCYERALELVPRHLEALLALETLYRRLSRHDALAKVYATQARVLQDPLARIAALRELARATARAEDGDQETRAVHEAILSLSPDDPGSLEALEATALAAGDRALLAQVDRRRIATSRDPRVAAAYQTRLADTLETADDAASLLAYRAALVQDPENLAAARGLGRVARRLGDAAAQVEAAKREAAVSPEPERAARLLVRAADITRRELGDDEAALADFERALELWPDDAAAAAGTAELLLAASEPALAADRLGRAVISATSKERSAALLLQVAALQADRMNNTAAAVASLGRVLEDNPSHVPALRRLASLHEREGRWSEAAELLAKVISLAPDRDLLRGAHLSLATIWDEHLADPSRALVSLQAVLSLDPKHPAALRRLARLSSRTGDHDKALETLRRLVETAQNQEDEALAWVMLSEVHSAREDAEDARAAALRAVALGGPESPGVIRHHALVESKADWHAQAEALRAWLKGSSDPLARRACRIEIARITSDELARPARAAEELERAVREQPTDAELRRLLAVNLRLSGSVDEAARGLRRILDDQPSKAELWRELAATERSAGRGEAAQRALMPLLLMGCATPDERDEAARYPSRPGAGAAGSLAGGVLEGFYPISRVAALTELLRLLMPAIAKLYPADLEPYGVTTRERLSARSSDPVRGTADHLAALFGVEEFHLYPHRARGRGVAVELSSPPAIMVPTWLGELSDAHRVFALTRAMSDLGVGLYAVDKLTPRELQIVLASVSRRVADGFGSGLTSEDVLDDVGKRLHKALPRRSRKLLDDAARAYVGATEVDFAHLVAAIFTSANRIALVVADDLLAAVDVLRRSERDLGELSGEPLLSHPLVSRLARFWVSEEADLLRARLVP